MRRVCVAACYRRRPSACACARRQRSAFASFVGKRSPHDEETTAQALRDEGYVFLDEVAPDKFRLTHMLTQESVELPQGTWQLFFDEESGDAVVCRGDGNDTGDVLHPCDLFERNAYVSDKSGEIFIQSKLGTRTIIQAFDADASKFAEAKTTLSINVGVVAHVELPTYVFKLARPGNVRFYWACIALYKHLNMRSFSGIASKWLHGSQPGWDRSLKEITGRSQFVLGSHKNLGEQRLSALPFRDRCLPTTAVTTWAFVVTYSVGVLDASAWWLTGQRRIEGFPAIARRAGQPNLPRRWFRHHALLGRSLGSTLATARRLPCSQGGMPRR